MCIIKKFKNLYLCIFLLAKSGHVANSTDVFVSREIVIPPYTLITPDFALSRRPEAILIGRPAIKNH